jgi:hypothetical protein
MWQAVGPECAKVVGSAEVAQRIGNESCGTIIQSTASEAVFDRDRQLVADIRAGNKPMPPASQIDGLTARFLAMTSAASDLEKDLARDFGPEAAHRIAFGDAMGGCALEFEGSKPSSLAPSSLGSGVLP